MATYKLEQGTAPAVSLKAGEPMWQFVNRKAETDDQKLAAKMVKAGAVIVETEEAPVAKKAAKPKKQAEEPAVDLEAETDKEPEVTDPQE